MAHSESVWDYPRPPRLERTARRLRVELGGRVIAETERGWRVLETSHPPVYYFPREDVGAELVPAEGRSKCEWKGWARYWDVVAGERRASLAAWSFPDPVPAFGDLRDAVAFYPSRVDACYVDDERVVPQPGDFYGGWITPGLQGPFKGALGTEAW